MAIRRPNTPAVTNGLQESPCRSTRNPHEPPASSSNESRCGIVSVYNEVERAVADNQQPRAPLGLSSPPPSRRPTTSPRCTSGLNSSCHSSPRSQQRRSLPRAGHPQAISSPKSITEQTIRRRDVSCTDNDPSRPGAGGDMPLEQPASQCTPRAQSRRLPPISANRYDARLPLSTATTDTTAPAHLVSRLLPPRSPLRALLPPGARL